ncbi:MAG: hypothetical protein Q7U47_10635 [Paludibacter sp.]|nr:hypothetical protein [Paludibacter sp.]
MKTSNLKNKTKRTETSNKKSEVNAVPEKRLSSSGKFMRENRGMVTIIDMLAVMK